MKSPDITRILEELGSRDAQEAWAKFLESHAPLILQVVQRRERDPDQASDCFLFVCEQLCQNSFRRLRRFQVKGPASFPTWLRAVVRHLCIDWYRRQSGRERIFHSIARLPTLEQEIFRSVYEQGMELGNTFLLLRPRFPALTRPQLAEGLERVRQSLTSRQLWLLGTRTAETEPLEDGPAQGYGILPRQVPDPKPDPEVLAALKERRTSLARALSRLSRFDRLLVRLRFQRELTLEQVARLTNLGDPQRVDRRIRKILETLRKAMA